MVAIAASTIAMVSGFSIEDTDSTGPSFHGPAMAALRATNVTAALAIASALQPLRIQPGCRYPLRLAARTPAMMPAIASIDARTPGNNSPSACDHFESECHRIRCGEAVASEVMSALYSRI